MNYLFGYILERVKLSLSDLVYGTFLKVTRLDKHMQVCYTAYDTVIYSMNGFDFKLSLRRNKRSESAK